MPVVIKIISRADLPWQIANDVYLQKFDPEAHGGRGEYEFTTDAKQAMSFTTIAEALTYWRTQSKTVPLRPDGKANRPLTAFNVSLEEVSLL
jgi:hypothetical protein